MSGGWGCASGLQAQDPRNFFCGPQEVLYAAVAELLVRPRWRGCVGIRRDSSRTTVPQTDCWTAPVAHGVSGNSYALSDSGDALPRSADIVSGRRDTMPGSTDPLPADSNSVSG
jgi:hypothetical protein